MSRTEIAPHLIHPAEPSQAEDKQFDALCRIAFICADPLVFEALHREVAETAAEVWVEEAKQALKDVVKSIPEEFASAAEDVKRALASAGGKVPPPDIQEVAEHSSDLSKVMISCWLEILRRSLLNGEILRLSQRLLPEKQDADALNMIVEATSSFVLNREQIGGLLQNIRKIIVLQDRPALLPSDIVLLQRRDHEIVAGSTKQIPLKQPLDLVGVADASQNEYLLKVRDAGRLHFSWRDL
jgi:hypothetical protein